MRFEIRHFCAKMQDILITDIRYLLPCAVKWLYHRKIKRDVSHHLLRNPSGKKAGLYQHGTGRSEDGDAPAILILHGLYSHPFVMSHLAEITKKIGPTFSLFVRYDEVNLNSHRSLIQQAINSVEKILHAQGLPFKGLILVGHSMGAIEAAYSAFVENDKRILSVISIAGRLKVVESTTSPCRESLKETIDKIYERVRSNPDLPLYQIAGGRDWNASLESTLIRRSSGSYHVIEKSMHFNILFHKDIYQKLPEFLKLCSCR